jgi:hypothetical protein
MSVEVRAHPLNLEIIPGKLALCRLASGATQLPDWLQPGKFQYIVFTDKETSILCEEKFVPPEVKAERGWRGIRIITPLDFNMIGVMTSLLDPLAKSRISILALSTYDTDYIFVKDEQLEHSVEVLEEVGHIFKHES